jgi:hypothetical protein
MAEQMSDVRVVNLRFPVDARPSLAMIAELLALIADSLRQMEDTRTIFLPDEVMSSGALTLLSGESGENTFLPFSVMTGPVQPFDDRAFQRVVNAAIEALAQQDEGQQDL